MSIAARSFLIIVFVSALAAACERNGPTPVIAAQTTITIGDIYPENPAARTRRIQPLADYLGKRLGAVGIERGAVVVDPDIATMAAHMRHGRVDILIDSPYPLLAVKGLAGGEILLLNQAQDDANYWGILIARADSPLTKLRDLLGQVVVFQSPHSTSGFLLPAAYIMEAGYPLSGASGPAGDVPAGHIGCTFSGSEATTIELVLAGTARAGAISNQDFRALPQATRDQLKILARTYHVPRQLVAVRSGLGAPMTAALQEALLTMTDAQREALAAQDGPLGWTWRFKALTPVMRDLLRELEYKFERLPDCT